MSFKLILSEPVETSRNVGENSKNVGENVFLNDLSYDYKVFMFYYPGAMPNQGLEDKLRSLGRVTGSNLFVNVGRFDDPNYEKIADHFGVETTPVIIVTAIDKLASAPDLFSTAYVRIDSKSLFKSPDELMECLQKLFNLFITGRISEAMSEYNKDKLNLFLSRFKDNLKLGFQEIWRYFESREFVLSLAGVKIELKESK